MASELINKGYSQYYIHDCVEKVFFSDTKQVDSIDILDEFFERFSGEESQYSVYLPINSIKQKRAIESYGLFQIEENIYEMFDPSIPHILKYRCKSIDPYSAREEALNLINFCLSVNQFIKHNRYDYNPKYADVVNEETHKVTFIKKPEPAIDQGLSDCEKLEVNDLLNTCLKLNGGALQVLQLHSSALISKNTDNQLINLWTAIEVAVPVFRKDNLSRINQISNVLTAALSCDYFSALISHLFIDIKNVAPSCALKVENIEFEGDIDSKLLAVLVLPTYQASYESIVNELLQISPLLACRMHQYKTNWSTTESIKSVYVAHTSRLSQQIMRIYRTRNMLVHDGKSLPYTDYVLQNLHYYVDSFMKSLNNYYRLGYKSIRTIVDAIQFQEQLYLQSLSPDVQINGDTIHKFILRNNIR